MANTKDAVSFVHPRTGTKMTGSKGLKEKIASRDAGTVVPEVKPEKAPAAKAESKSK